MKGISKIYGDNAPKYCFLKTHKVNIAQTISRVSKRFSADNVTTLLDIAYRYVLFESEAFYNQDLR